MDTQIGLLGEKKYSLALDNGSVFNSYNLMLTNNLLLYLTNVISHDFFIRFDATENVPIEISVPREIITRIFEPVYSP